MIEVEYTTNIKELLDITELQPQPARNFIPSWYKKTPSTNNKNETIVGHNYKNLPLMRTVKTCPSFHDVFNDGLVLVSPCDIHIGLFDNDNTYRWEVAIKHQDIRLETHDDLQFLDYYDSQKIRQVFKLVSPFYFKTPAGYSLRQIPYMYDDKDDFTVPYGIINSDVFHEVNPQILYTSKDNDILIKAGQPLCYLVPFKREKTNLKLLKEGKKRDKFLQRHRKHTYITNKGFRSSYYNLK